MGSGKSTVGRILADLLHRPFIDLDEFIVQRAGMSIMASGLVVYLRSTPDTLSRRLRSEAQGRPLLAGEGRLEDRIASLLRERSGSYELAHWNVDTDDLTPEQVASNIHRRIREEIGD